MSCAVTEKPEAAASPAEAKPDSEMKTETPAVEAAVAEGAVAEIKASEFLAVEGKKENSQEGSRKKLLEPVSFCIDATITVLRGGLSIYSVIEKGASARAGVCQGNMLLAIGGKAVSSLKEISSCLMLCRNDASVSLTLRLMDGSVCDRVVLCNTAVTANEIYLPSLWPATMPADTSADAFFEIKDGQEVDACNCFGTPDAAQVVQRKTDT